MASSATSFLQGSYPARLVLLERALVLEVGIAEEWLQVQLFHFAMFDLCPSVAFGIHELEQLAELQIGELRLHGVCWPSPIPR